jgi:hypothetical protein
MYLLLVCITTFEVAIRFGFERRSGKVAHKAREAKQRGGVKVNSTLNSVF